jgi:glycosyltransferase involved in cell wall biosynthesis
MRRTRRRGSYDVAFYAPAITPLLTDLATAPTGGAETQIFLVAKTLARRGLRVCLSAFELPDLEIPRSIEGVDVALRRPYRAGQVVFPKLREPANIVRALMAIRADVFVTRIAGPHVGLVGLVAKLLGRRFVYSSANISDFGANPLVGVHGATRLHHELFRLGVRIADEVVVQTAHQARVCEERFGREPVLIRSIAEPAQPRAVVPEAFLWIGRFVAYKKPLAFLDLARSLPEAHFWMVGVPSTDNAADAELRDRVQGAAASIRNLTLLAPRPRSQLMDLMARSVAVVNTAEFEGMPNVFLEGWARGVPALALSYDPDGLIEQHKLGGFAHGSPERLVELAGRLWKERSDQHDLADSCRRYVSEQHSANAVGELWQETLTRVANLSAA